MDPFTCGASFLNDFQVDILDECLIKGSGGMSVPMGAGKTLLGILLGLQQADPDANSDSDSKPNSKPNPNSNSNSNTNAKVLVICAKNLVASWEFEITKFFGDSLKYEVFQSDKQKKMDFWKPQPETKLVITTPDVTAKYYKQHAVMQYFVDYFIDPINPFLLFKRYNRPTKPFLGHSQGGGYLFSQRWGCLLVDEAQRYTNINTGKCQSIGSICAKHRWALSGTLFEEPKIERILGYYTILDIPNSPRDLSAMGAWVYSLSYRGLSETTVYRSQNIAFTPPNVNEKIIDHQLSPEEAILYTSMKATLNVLRERVRDLKRDGDVGGARRFSSYILAMVTYLRQSLVCPLIPISSVVIDMADYKGKSELSKVLLDQIQTIGIDDWLQNESSVYSTRMREVVKVVNQHPDDRIVIFSCFRSCIEVLRTFLPMGRQVLTIKASMKTTQRGDVIQEFEESDDGILLLTYELGSEGLNLQCSNTVLLMDFFWNSAKTKQAIARILRFGQKALDVNVYFFISNTGLEKSLFEKQRAKEAILQELQHGSWKTKIPVLSMKEILNIIDKEDNLALLQGIMNVPAR